MNGKLFVTISLGVFVGGAALYVFVKHCENHADARAAQEPAPEREIGFAAILAQQKEHAVRA